MTISALFTTALTLALGTGLPLSAPHNANVSEPEVIIIDDLGMHNAPAQWFADAVVTPGDSAERTILIQNGRSDATTITVALTDVEPPEDQGLLTDLRLRWGTSVASVAEVAASAPILADEVVLAPGEQLPLTLGYEYDHDVTRIPAGMQTLTFTISINALDPNIATGNTGNKGGDSSDGDLATTGGELSPWWAGALMSVLLGWWLIAFRRKRRRTTNEDPMAVEGAV